MIEKSDKELLDALGIEVEKKVNLPKNPKEEYIISGFEEIQNYFEKFKRVPENIAERDLFERLLAVRLNQIKQNEEILNILKPYKIIEIVRTGKISVERELGINSELLRSI